MMKGKIMAVAAVLVMVFAAVGVVMPQAGNSDADTTTTTTDLGWIVLVSGTTNSGTRTINTTEGQFTGYAYTMTMSIGQASELGTESESSWTVLGTTTASADGSNLTATYNGSYTGVTSLTVSVAKNGDENTVGSYTLTATCTSTFTTSNLVLKASIVSTVNGDTTDTQTVYYSFAVVNGSEVAGSMTLTDITDIKGGEYKSQRVEATIGSAVDEDNYYWYAYGLPSGLSMSATGYVSGVCTHTSTGDVTAKVVAVHKTTGAYYAGDLKCTVSSAYSETAGLVLKVEENSAEVTEGANIVKTTSSTAMTLTISATYNNGDVSSSTTYSVIAVDSTGAVKDLYSSGTSVSVPLTGSGAYRIVVTATYTDSTGGTGTYEDTLSFYLYVMPVFENLSAHITVTTGS